MLFQKVWRTWPQGEERIIQGLAIPMSLWMWEGYATSRDAMGGSPPHTWQLWLVIDLRNWTVHLSSPSYTSSSMLNSSSSSITRPHDPSSSRAHLSSKFLSTSWATFPSTRLRGGVCAEGYLGTGMWGRECEEGYGGRSMCWGVCGEGYVGRTMILVTKIDVNLKPNVQGGEGVDHDILWTSFLYPESTNTAIQTHHTVKSYQWISCHGCLGPASALTVTQFW